MAKKNVISFVFFEKVCTFALANNKSVGRCKIILFNGVMVAQQILVLLVQVRALVEQQGDCLS